jgi:transcription elongation factor Elf1
MKCKSTLFSDGHRWAKQTRVVTPGTYQKRCTRCGKIKNVKCGTFFNSHRWKRDRRRKKNILVCKKCRTTMEVANG